NCYYKEADKNKKNHMKVGRSKDGNLIISYYDLKLEERKAKYNIYDNVLCEKCNKEIDINWFRCCACYDMETDIDKKNWMKYGLNVRIFKTSDYNLDRDERKAKYEDYNHILCEKCN